jgi:hypothetical protein
MSDAENRPTGPDDLAEADKPQPFMWAGAKQMYQCPRCPYSDSSERVVAGHIFDSHVGPARVPKMKAKTMDDETGRLAPIAGEPPAEDTAVPSVGDTPTEEA